MDNPEQRIGFWWRLSHDCPKCGLVDIPITKFFYDAEGGFKIHHVCVKCATEFYWDLNPFKLAARAHDQDDFECFNRTPALLIEARHDDAA